MHADISWATDKLDNSQLALATTVGLRKLFHDVNHHALLRKLACYSVPSSWFRIHLSSRGQMVRGGASDL